MEAAGITSLLLATPYVHISLPFRWCGKHKWRWALSSIWNDARRVEALHFMVAERPNLLHLAEVGITTKTAH